MKPHFKSGEDKLNELEIDATKLKEKLDKGEDVFILDVRTPEEHNAWKFSYDKYQKTSVIPIDRLASSQEVASEEIPKDKEIVTVCTHGHRGLRRCSLKWVTRLRTLKVEWQRGTKYMMWRNCLKVTKLVP
jgi:rhodanese-related sulfurtransferase